MNGDVEAIKKELDVVVVGGGIIGATVFRELCYAGLNVLLLEKDDFACDISSGSTEMAHGGFRYLLTLNDWGLVQESIIERETLHFIAPHLVRRLNFYMPLYSGDEMYFNPSYFKVAAGDITWKIRKYSGIGAMMVGAGMNMYKLFAISGIRKRDLGTNRAEVGYKKLKPEEFLSRGFRANPDGLVAAYRYTDSKIEDIERLVTENILSGLEYGKNNGQACSAFNMTEVIKISADGEIVARDSRTEKEFSVKPKVVVNAAGAGINSLNEQMDTSAGSDVHMVAGTHLLISRQANWDSTDPDAAVGWWTNRKIMFAISKGTERLLIGTHERYVKKEDVKNRNLNYTEDLNGIIERTKKVFPDMDMRLERDPYYTRVRPLTPEDKHLGEADPTRFSRRDYMKEIGNVISVTGKIGPSRFLAEMVARKVTDKLGRNHQESRTCSTPLYGGHIEGSLEEYISAVMAKNPGVDNRIIRNLIKRYGSRYEEVIGFAGEGGLDPINPYVADSQPLCALLYSFKKEGAQSLVHAFRRTGTYRHLDEGRGCVDKAASYLAGQLNWDENRRSNEINDYTQYIDGVKKRV